LYQPADFGMLRTPLLPMQNSLPSLGENVDDATEAELASFLRASASDPVLRETIEVSAPSLARLLEQVVQNAPIRKAQLRKAALSVARYVIRAGNRSTPFGLLAGVSPLHFGSCTSVVPGLGHTKCVSLDGAWLVEILRVLERRHEIMMELDLVVDHEVVRKGRSVHFYTDSQQKRRSTRTPSIRKVLRSHVVVDQVLRFAARPIRAGLLLDRLEEVLPDQSRLRLISLVGQLVRSRMLLTSLQPPLDARDPLEHVLSQLEAIPDVSVRSLATQLRELKTRMKIYQATAVGQGNEELAAVHRAALQLSDRHVPDVQVDLRLSEQVTLPRSVAEEAAAAVEALWRMSRRENEQRTQLRSYLERFEEVYGRDALVPLNTLLDAERGLGHPAVWSKGSGTRGDLESMDGATAEVRREERRRSLVLAELAWPAGPYASEIVIRDATVDALARTSPISPLTTTEAVFDLVAGSTEGIDRGDYRLVLKGSSHRAAALFGRFSRLLPELDESLRQVFAHGASHGVPAQLVLQATAGFAYLVGDAPRWMDQVVTVGEFGRAGEYGHGAGRRTDHDATDILIGVRDGDFRVVSASTGEELQLAQANVMSMGKWATPAARFLSAVSRSQGRPWHPWSWGEFSAAPRLPRIRYGNSILSLERWRASREMVEAGGDRQRWQRAFDVWRERYDVPDEVGIGLTDKRLVLDLRSRLHQQLLHEEMRKSSDMRIEEVSVRTGSGGGWLHGRVTEVVLPLLAAAPQHRPLPRSLSVPPGDAGPLSGISATTTCATTPATKTYMIGSEWLYAKFYSSAHLHDEILAEGIPQLLDAIGTNADRSFFLRYRDPGEHIRLRLHGRPDRLLGHVLPLMRAWAEKMCDLGLVREWSLHNYSPEVLVYGGAEVMAAAESVFHADGRVAATQLNLLRANKFGVDQELALTLNLVDIARGMYPEDWASWLVTEIPRDPHRDRFRARRGELRALVGADRDVVAKFCGGDELADAWHSRAAALAVYQEQLAHRHRGTTAVETQSRVLKSLLHMHHNRAKGIDVESEAIAYAMARGFAELTINSARFKRS
jgi:thiopeptide-type bacteriocin biosynthesis protein